MCQRIAFTAGLLVLAPCLILLATAAVLFGTAVAVLETWN